MKSRERKDGRGGVVRIERKTKKQRASDGQRCGIQTGLSKQKQPVRKGGDGKKGVWVYQDLRRGRSTSLGYHISLIASLPRRHVWTLSHLILTRTPTALPPA